MNSPSPDADSEMLQQRCIGAEATIGSDPLAASAALRDIAVEARQGGSARLAVRADRARARALAYAGRYEESLAQARACISEATRLELVEECARAQLAAMHALVETGRLQEALAEGSAARELLKSRGMPALRARADINLGIVHQRLDQPEEALQCFEQAAADVSGEPLILGQLENNRGETLLRLYRFDEARRCFQASLDANTMVGAELTAAIAQGNIADLEARRGDLASAIPMFESAIERLQPLGAPGHLLRLRAELAEALMSSGLVEAARDAFAQLTRLLDEAGLRREAARVRAGHGRALAQCQDYSQARTALRAAEAEYAALADATEAARVGLDMAALELANGNSEEAQRLADRVVAALRERPIDRCRAELMLARCARMAGRGAEALARLDLARAASAGIKPIEAEADLEESHARESLQQWDQALAAASRAAATLESIRSSLPARRLRLAFRDAAVAHGRKLELLLELGGDPLEVLQSLEAIESRASTDGGNHLSHAQAPAEPLSARRDGLVATLNALYSMVADSGPQDPRHSDWRARVAQVESDLDEIEQQLEGRRCGIRSGALRESLAALPGALSSDEVVIRFGSHADELIAVVMSRDGVEFRRNLTSVSEVERLVRALHYHMRRAALVAEPTNLHQVQLILARIDATLRPALETLGDCRSPVIVPSGALALIPFHALERFRSSDTFPTVTPSAGALARVLAMPPLARPTTVLAVGVGDESIPGAETEAADVAQTWGSAARLLLGQAATAEQVRQGLESSDLVHIASHGWFAPAVHAASGLRLADRWMNRREIQALTLRGGAIVLSGCETGPGGSGGDASGLFSAFLQGGARHVVASLWTVRDEICRKLMVRLHGRWHDESSGDWRNALAQEISRLRSEHPHPAHWAPFGLFGSPR